ncbi:MAG: PDZ domain-containing protein [Acidobacteria bacterium]|nr:MAG: PDZ domain-containing protein [Acidobacteriota bacterium]
MSKSCPLAALAVLLLAALPLAAQIVEEDLADPEMTAEELPPPAPLDPALVELFDEAEDVFNSPAQADSLPLLGRVIEGLQAVLAAGNPPPEARRLLALSLSYRAQAELNLGADDKVRADLEELLRVQPSFDFDRQLVSPRLVEQLDALRERMVGYVSLTAIDPPDLELRVDGRRVDALAGPIAVLAGQRRLSARRPGYAPQSLEVEVEAASTTSVEVVLERTSAVLRLQTRPPGALVVIDGVGRGVTGGTAPEGSLPPSAAAVYPREEFSDVFVLEGLPLGRHQLEIRLEGYRPHPAVLHIEQLIDYEIPPIVLQRQQGTLVLRDLPAGATVRLDGRPATIDERRGDDARLILAPGDYRLLIEQGPSKMLTRRFSIADRQTVEIDVRLQPGLALLGVLGGDREAGQRLAQALAATLGRTGKWTVIDHAAAAAPLLAGSGADAAALRQGAGGIDWPALQRRLDDALPGLVYVLGVLSSDLLATHADLLIWPAAPGPPRPDRLHLALDDRSELERLEAAFNRSLRLHRPWLGAQLIDSLASTHPVVVAVTAGGPAATAGLRVGDRVTAVAQVPVDSVAALDERIAAAEVGEAVTLTVRSAAGERTVRVSLGDSPLILAPEGGERLWSVTFADLMLLEERAGDDELWIVRLNRAQAFLETRAWVAAARELRAVRVPHDGGGVGRGTVEYQLGIALAHAGEQYRDTARSHLERAAGDDGARLYHNDGPWIAPRAQAWLIALGEGQP